MGLGCVADIDFVQFPEKFILEGLANLLVVKFCEHLVGGLDAARCFCLIFVPRDGQVDGRGRLRLRPGLVESSGVSSGDLIGSCFGGI